ncbi:Signal transduction histidine kinase [Loktanella atrilutea]|uniref:Oxygen sensor histidine kinase NreB n=1 Tax=Loktanella atrilutea TaxID=366533 RepID=A0A1M5FWL0_LOKAT|nr:Signal transduction histidine kinase [Loktanella atrilutea]
MVNVTPFGVARPKGGWHRGGQDLASSAGHAGGLADKFARLPLHHRFAWVGSLVSLGGMIAIGSFVSQSIETGVVRNSAISSAVYMESFIAPLSQELAGARNLSPDTIAHLQDLLDQPPLSEQILSAKIWREDGFIAFATDSALIGRKFEAGDDLERAWAGDLNATFDELDSPENQHEQKFGVPLLEVYNPIHSIVTGEVIAVAEFYLNGTELHRDLLTARWRAWSLVAFVTVVTFAALFGIVRSGSRTIAAQTDALAVRLDDLARISAQNTHLRKRVQTASRGAAETHERYMRRISAELHDGPAQALALASLRLDALMRRSNVSQEDGEARTLRTTLGEALRDVRDLCRGLTLPQLEGRSIVETLEAAVSAHERRTGTTLGRFYGESDFTGEPVPHPILICIYRFVQEGLMNAYRHAPDSKVTVSYHTSDDRMTVSVTDTGPGFDVSAPSEGLGLSGLRERVESIGGEFDISSQPHGGTRLRFTLPRDIYA